MNHIGSALPHHQLALHRDEAFVGTLVADFVAGGSLCGEGAVVIVDGERWPSIRDALEGRGYDVRLALATDWLVVLDSGVLVDELMAAGDVDAAALGARIGPLVERVRTATGVRGVNAFGDAVNTLWKLGQAGLALRLENAWHDLLKTEPLTLLCAYHVEPLDPGVDPGPLLPLCRAHGTLAASENSDQRDGAIRRAIGEVLGNRQQGRLELVAAAAGLPTGPQGTEEVTLLWLRTQLPHMAQRIMTHANRILEEEPELDEVG